MVKKNTKEKLIETALNLIWRDSYDAVSVEEICKSAGVLKGSFYHYFPSKKDLAHATLEQCRKEFRKTYDEIFSPLNSPLERFEKMADHKIEMQERLFLENGYVLGCPTGGFRQGIPEDDNDGRDDLRNIGRESLTYFKDALQDLKTDGLIDSQTDIDRRAEEIYIFMTGALTTARMSNDLSFFKESFKPSLMRIIGITK